MKANLQVFYFLKSLHFFKSETNGLLCLFFTWLLTLIDISRESSRVALEKKCFSWFIDRGQ